MLSINTKFRFPFHYNPNLTRTDGSFHFSIRHFEWFFMICREKLYREVVYLSMQVSYVYILKCSDNTYYTGITSNLTARLVEHETGKHKDSYTYSRRPIELVFYAEFTDISQAISTEKQIKKWSKDKKEALINGDFEKLPNLAKKKFDK